MFAYTLQGEFGGPVTADVISCIGSLAFSAFAFGCVVTAARLSHGRRRAAWATLSVGLFGWVVGDTIWAYYRLSLDTYPPYPSVADPAYLLLPVAACVGWMINVSGGPRFLAIRPVLDGIMVASSLFMLAWLTVLKNLLAGADDLLQLGVALAYPLADIVMVTVAIVVLSNIPAGHRRTLGLIAAGMAAIAVADGALTVLNAHGVRTSWAVVVGWAAGLTLMGVGALLSHDVPGPDMTRRSSRALFWLPYLPLLFAIPAGAVALWSPSPHDAPVLIAGVVLVTAALVRQFTVLVENRALLETVAHQALSDRLTGLANRLLFSDRLAHAMQLRERDGRDVAVLSLDLDDFRLVNDDLGTPLGDSLLQAVADRLLTAVPTGDTVARLGGDEFAVVIEGGPDPRAVARRVIEAFDKPFFLDGEELYIHPSAGLAAAPEPDGGSQISPEELLKRANLAMFAAKRAGVGGVLPYSQDMQEINRRELRTSLDDNVKRPRSTVSGIQLLGQLRRAIDERELTLVYQPKVSLSTGEMVGVEALIRWPHPELGLLTPNQFLPLVRKNGLMGAVTDVVLDIAARDAATWFDIDSCNLPVAINLFAPSLNDMTLPERIGATLKRAELPPAALSVEITEHLLLANIRRATTVIERLRATGVCIAIDDFGSGYATMSYLRDLPIDELKLDRQFIAPVLRSERVAAIVRSVIDLAHTLGIGCVAEGVENRATADRLREYGCDIAQGHYFARPMPIDDLQAQLAASSSAIFPITN